MASTTGTEKSTSLRQRGKSSAQGAASAAIPDETPGQPSHPGQEPRLAQYAGLVVASLVTFLMVYLLSAKAANERVWYPEELKGYTGADGKPILVAILGSVFDVSKGGKHYGVGGSYSHFAGRDASRSFVTGDFSEKGLTDDVEGLTPEQMVSLAGWEKFYRDTYKYVGKLWGRFYDDRGQPTSALLAAQAAIAAGKIAEANKAEEEKVHPTCNSRWSQADGGEVWCENGYPRKQFATGGVNSGMRCACFQAEELGRPDIKGYEGCGTYEARCKTS